MLLSSSIENYIKVSSSRLYYDKWLQLEPIQYGITLCIVSFNPLNAELNPICHLLALLGSHHIFHVSVLRVNKPKSVNKNPTDATVCRYLFTAKLLYMFRVSQHPSSGVLKTVPAASGRDSHKAVPIRPRWRGVAVQVVWPVPEAAGTVLNTPDDGCCDTRNM